MLSFYTVADIIGAVETANNPKRIRFEPVTYAGLQVAEHLTPAKIAIINNISKFCNCSHYTAEMIYSTSWGEFQAMGFNIYGDGAYKMSPYDFQADTGAQQREFKRYCVQHKIDFTVQDLANSPDKRHAFALAYNGASSYADSIVEQLKKHGFTVKEQ